MMPIVTLTTDWNKQDFYTGALKGKILSLYREVRIIDITHQIKSFNLPEAAFVVRNTYPYFPENTIHIITVKSEISSKNPTILVKKDKQYFLSADNGIFGLIFQDNPDEIIDIDAKPSIPTFPSLDIYAEIIRKLLSGVSPEKLGQKKKDFNKRIPLRPTIDESVIIGRVVYIDSYFNAITNISADLFQRIGNKRKFQIFVQSNTNKISKISKTYNENPVGELLALFNSLNLLEVAMNGGNAAQILALDTDSTVRVRFY
ncbi:MAG: SAM hydrolase/SAM-dependent halogenase family protein [Bacteroidota bacterium]